VARSQATAARYLARGIGCLALLLALPSGAASQARRLQPLPPPAALGRPGKAVTIRDPSGRALQPFHAAWRSAAAGQGIVRIAFFGASHTASDLMSGQLRRLLQDRLGDAGHGFALPMRWNHGYRHQDLVVEATPGWQAERHLQVDGEKVGDYGYAGLVMASAATTDTAELRTTNENHHGRALSRLELWLRTGPDGGDLDLAIDGATQRLSTKAERPGVRFEMWDLADGPHAVRLQPAGTGTVAVYGLIAERGNAGAVVDQLGIPGMRAEIQLHWREDLWRELITRRKPNLVVLAYGTNDVGDVDQPPEAYALQWRQVLARVRRAVPDAACLIVGPSDRLYRGPHRKLATMPRTPEVIAIQRAVAAEFGCGHWDMQAAMGGPGSMRRWQRAGLATGDNVHLTREGYAWMGELLHWALVREAQLPPKRQRPDKAKKAAKK
jgi:lysophospholipase L1-like esterase